MTLTSRRTTSAAVVGSGILALALASVALAPTAGAQISSTQVATAAASRAGAMHDAAAEFGVPENVLLAVSYNESRWENHAGQPSADGGYGLLHLTTAVPARDGRGKDADAARTLDTPSRHTLEQAAQLLGVTTGVLKTDDRQNARGGAAVLAQYARELGGGQLPATAGDWYGAVAKFGGATDTTAAALFADDVFATVRDGATLTTTDGQTLSLPATPTVQPRRDQLDALRLRRPGGGSPDAAECPAILHCAFVPAAYTLNNPADLGDYGNYDHANRPSDVDIKYIVIHDTEGSYASAISTFQNPQNYVSAHYVIRSSDGAVTQMVRDHDIAWHAGNWWLNMHSIGIEHEGVAIDGASWYTEAMYRSSAALVRYLAAKYHIPLDREHIIGHDGLPGPTPALVAGMHWDPGPFWDWTHYMALLRAPVEIRPGGGLVTITPNFRTNKQVLTDCTDGTCVTLPAQGSNFVYLHTAPSDSAPLLSDPAIHPDGSPGTTQANDWSDKAVAGQQFVRFDRRGEWVGIWFGGQVGWFRDGFRSSVQSCGRYVTPRAGLTSIAVYGRAYPEAAAYEGTTVTVQSVVPLQYSIGAGQRYATTGQVPAGYYSATTFNGPTTSVEGQEKYLQISFNHRLAFVLAADVNVRTAC